MTRDDDALKKEVEDDERRRHARRGCYEIPSEDIAFLFSRKPTPEMKARAEASR